MKLSHLTASLSALLLLGLTACTPESDSTPATTAATTAPAGDYNSVAVTRTTFPDVVLNSEIPVLVDFWAEWCGPCLALAPTLEEVATEYKGKVLVAKVDVDDYPDLAQQYGVRGIPNLKIFQGGKVTGEIVGLVPKTEITNKLDQL